MKNQVQLITYIERLAGGGIRDLDRLLRGPLNGLFGGVHLLPFFHPIDGADAGFDPIDHTQIDPRLGGWDDLRALAADAEIAADLIVNHVSSASRQYESFSCEGDIRSSTRRGSAWRNWIRRNTSAPGLRRRRFRPIGRYLEAWNSMGAVSWK